MARTRCDIVGDDHKTRIRQLISVNVVVALSFLEALAIRDLFEAVRDYLIPMKHYQQYRIRFYLLYTILIFFVLILAAILL